jgi:hypothetical protein
VDPLTKGKSKKETKVFDPLSQAAFDPLSNPSPNKGFLSASTASVNSSATTTASTNEPDYPSWEPRKAAILAKYTTNKTIAVPSFVTGMKQKPNVPVDRVKNRLEQLDQDEEEDETLQLSQKDYIKHIEKKRESLIEAWDTDKRVKALKIAIKVCSLLCFFIYCFIISSMHLLMIYFRSLVLYFFYLFIWLISFILFIYLFL